MPPRNVSDRLSTMVGRTVSTSIQVRCYGGGPRSRCYADYVDFQIDGKLVEEGKISPVESYSNGHCVTEYYRSFVLPFDVTIEGMDERLLKKTVRFGPVIRNVRITYYYRGVQVETDELKVSLFPESTEIKKSQDPIVHEFLSDVGKKGIAFRPDDANLKRIYKAVGP